MTDLVVPPIQRITDGFTVAGASPEMLTGLLERLDFEVARRSPHAWDTAQPGLSRVEIVDRLGLIGVEPPEELIAWWMWRNGHIEGRPARVPVAQASLEASIRYREFYRANGFYLKADFSTPLESQNWLHLDREGHLIACCDSSSRPPIVMNVYTHAMVPDEYRGNLSLCTPVALWVTSIINGWIRLDEDTGFWRVQQEIGDREAVPPELLHAQLFG